MLHPHGRELVAERAAGKLGEDALKLAARRGDVVGDVGQGEARLGVALLDREGRIREERGATRCGDSPVPAGGHAGPLRVRTRGRARREVGDALAVAEQLKAPGEAGSVQRPAQGWLRTDDDELVLSGVQATHRVEEQHGGAPVGDLGRTEVEGHGLLGARVRKGRTRGAARCRDRCAHGP